MAHEPAAAPAPAAPAAPAGAEWGFWIAIGWAALLVAASLAIALDRTSLLHVLDIRGLFR